MKKMKKLFAMLIAMVMVLGMSLSVFVGTITVDNVLKGEEYTAYKILNYTSDITKEPAAYSYYLTADQYTSGLGAILEAEGFEFQVSADGTQYVLTNAEEITSAEPVAASLYSKLDTWKDLAIASTTTTAATADADSDETLKAVFEGIDPGYWFVTSSLGALCSLQSYDDEALVVEKNETFPVPEKEASDTEYQVGDTVDYTITITDVAGTNNSLKVTDTMSAGLTYKADTLKVKVNGTEVTTGFTVNPTVDTDGATLVLEFTAETIASLEANQTIEITYSAVVNNSASLDGSEKNTVVLNYSEQETTPVEVVIESYDMTINKTDGTDALKGAKFELYRDADPSAEVAEGETAPAALTLRALTDAELEAAKITKATDTVYYQIDTSVSNTTIDMENASSAVVYGLDKDSTYYVLEIKAPNGYNMLDKAQEVAGGTASIDVVNQAGSVLPSTGGSGTTIFYVIGAILVIGAGVVLVSRRRAN